MKEHTKKIKILSKGVLPCKGFIYGPVLTPYDETLDTIFQLIAGGVIVVEVTDMGEEIPLTTSNFEENHSKDALVEKEVAKKKDDEDKKKKSEEEAIAKQKAEDAKRLKADEEVTAKQKAENDKRIKETAEREAAKNRQNDKNNNQSHTSVIENTKVTDEVLEKK